MNKSKTVFSTLLVMLLWGSLFPVCKLGYAAYSISGTGSILLFAGIRFVSCGALICIYRLISAKDSYKSARHSILPILLSGLFAVILHYSFTYMALSMTDSSKTAILKQTGALFYVCFSFLFFKEDKPSVVKLISAAIGFLGIISINMSNGSTGVNLGDLFVILASFCTVFSNVISKKALQNTDTIVLTGLSQFFGGTVLLFIGIALGGQVNFTFEKIHIMIYICTASVISYCIWFSIVKKSDLSKLFIIKFAEPVFACIFSALLLGENILNIQYLIAFVLISFGIILANKKE